ncbi:ribonuclease H protein [Artemisia annua]|uniref:Ribonuclease H protein n=1 Tax=Artemisia annua TaxID=35608 RepID=A0A2U1MIP8_ARTAN|nr:ribonuclease H protein [Artemisia annua]
MLNLEGEIHVTHMAPGFLPKHKTDAQPRRRDSCDTQDLWHHTIDFPKKVDDALQQTSSTCERFLLKHKTDAQPRRRDSCGTQDKWVNGGRGRGLKSSVWGNIRSVGAAIDSLEIPFNNSFVRKVGCGDNSYFWCDKWVNSGLPLMVQFPRLYALERSKDCLIKDRWCLENDIWKGNWDWRASPRGRASSELQSLSSLLDGFVLRPQARDGWRWALSNDGLFTVKHLSSIIDSAYLADCSPVTDLVSGTLGNNFPGYGKTIFNGVCYSVLWHIWAWRNKVVHSKIEERQEELKVDIFSRIQSSTLLWLSNRWRKVVVSPPLFLYSFFSFVCPSP